MICNQVRDIFSSPKAPAAAHVAVMPYNLIFRNFKIGAAVVRCIGGRRDILAVAIFRYHSMHLKRIVRIRNWDDCLFHDLESLIAVLDERFEHYIVMEQPLQLSKCAIHFFCKRFFRQIRAEYEIDRIPGYFNDLIIGRRCACKPAEDFKYIARLDIPLISLRRNQRARPALREGQPDCFALQRRLRAFQPHIPLDVGLPQGFNQFSGLVQCIGLEVVIDPAVRLALAERVEANLYLENLLCGMLE